jgi:hypothetical protein
MQAHSTCRAGPNKQCLDVGCYTSVFKSTKKLYSTTDFGCLWKTPFNRAKPNQSLTLTGTMLSK